MEEAVAVGEAAVAGVEAGAKPEKTTTHAKALWPQGCENRHVSLTLSSIAGCIRVQREA